MVTKMRSCASEPSLVLLQRKESLQEEYKRRVRERRAALERRSFSLREENKSKAAGAEAGPRSRLSVSLLTALALIALAWTLGLHVDGSADQTDFDRALDSICPPLTKADNSSVKLTDFKYEDFTGNWHKVAWLRDPDSLDMRCSFVTDSKEARDVQHLEQISPAPDYKSKGYHFLLNRVSKLWVVDTDYKSWAMLYTCSPHFGTTSQQAFIVSRKKTLDIVTMGDVLTKWSEYNIPWKEFKIKEQHSMCS